MRNPSRKRSTCTKEEEKKKEKIKKTKSDDNNTRKAEARKGSTSRLFKNIRKGKNDNPTIQRSLKHFKNYEKPVPRLKSKISSLSLSLLNLNGPHSFSPSSLFSPSLPHFSLPSNSQPHFPHIFLHSFVDLRRRRRRRRRLHGGSAILFRCTGFFFLQTPYLQ